MGSGERFNEPLNREDALFLDNISLFDKTHPVDFSID